MTPTPAGVDLYWLPLGAGGQFVAFNGRVYEAIRARREHREPLDLYHTALIAAAAVATVGVGFFGLYRPWQLRWGATRDEVSRSLPGDEVVSRPTFNATRAVTIDARPEDVWPWIVQIGFGRAGWYSYDLLDNLGHRSAERIVPELQHTEVGNLVPLGPGEDAGMRVKGFEPNRWMLWWDARNQLTTWVWALDPMPEGGPGW